MPLKAQMHSPEQLTPAELLIERNIELRRLVERANHNVLFLKGMAHNLLLTVAQVYGSVVVNSLFNAYEDEDDRPLLPAGAWTALSFKLINTALLLMNSYSHISSVGNPAHTWGVGIAPPSKAIQRIFNERMFSVDNNQELNQYFSEIKKIIKEQDTQISLLLKVRAVLCAFTLYHVDSDHIINSVIQDLPHYALHLVDLGLITASYASNSENLKKFYIDQDLFAQPIIELFKDNFSFKIIDMKFITHSTLKSKDGTLDPILIYKAKLSTQKIRDKNIEQSIWFLRSVVNPSSIILRKDNETYVAYLHINSIQDIKNPLFSTFKDTLAQLENKVTPMWECKQALLHIKNNHRFACSVQHGFQLDGPLEAFTFNDIFDLDLFELLERLQKQHPEFITLQDNGVFSFNLVLLSQSDHKETFKTITRWLDENAHVMNATKALLQSMSDEDAHPSDDNEYTTDDDTDDNESQQNNGSSSSSAPAQKQNILHSFYYRFWAPAKPTPAAQKTLKWEVAEYNGCKCVSIRPFTQLQQYGTKLYIYYSKDFKETYSGNTEVAHQMKTYRQMLSKHSHGNGIKELRHHGTHALMAYYTSDKNPNADTRIVLKAVSVGKDANNQTIILLEPSDVFTHKQLLNYNDSVPIKLQDSVRILSLSKKDDEQDMNANVASGSNQNKVHKKTVCKK